MATEGTPPTGRTSSGYFQEPSTYHNNKPSIEVRKASRVNSAPVGSLQNISRQIDLTVTKRLFNQVVIEPKQPVNESPRVFHVAKFKQKKTLTQTKGDDSSLLYEIKATPVEKLKEKWRFHSDHLPIGVRVDRHEVISWNVLNADLIQKWIIDVDSQGLKGSIITELHHLLGGITEREIKIIALLESVMHLKKIIALQECRPTFINELAKKIPSNMKMIVGVPGKFDQVIMLYNSECFECVQEESIFAQSIFTSKPDHTVMTVVLEEKSSKKRYCIINTHIPGDPRLPAKQEMLYYMFNILCNTHMTVVALGDMNFDQAEMRTLSDKIAQDFGYESNPFTTIAPYRTNIGPDFSQVQDETGKWPLCAKAVDMFFIDQSHGAEIEPGGEIFPPPHAQLIQDALKLFIQKEVNS